MMIFKRLVALMLVVLTTTLFAARATALPKMSAASAASANALSVPPFTPNAAKGYAPDAGRCDVPVVWWTRWGQKTMPNQCNPRRHERGTVRVRANIDKDQPMALIIEWQILSKGKIKFRCTGPIALFYSSDNATDRYFTWNAKPAQDIQAVNLYVTVDGWSALDWDAASECVKNP